MVVEVVVEVHVVVEVVVEVREMEGEKWEEWKYSHVFSCEIVEWDLTEVEGEFARKRKQEFQHLHCQQTLQEGKQGVNILRWERWVKMSQ